MFILPQTYCISQCIQAFFGLSGTNSGQETTQYPALTTQPSTGVKFRCHSQPVALAFAHRQHSVWWVALFGYLTSLRPTISFLLLNSTTSLFLQEGQTHVRDTPPFAKVNPPRTNISFPHSSHIIPSMQSHFLFAISTTTKANVSTSVVRKHKQAHTSAGDSTHNQLHEITCVSFNTINATVTKPNRTTPPLAVNFIPQPPLHDNWDTHYRLPPARSLHMYRK